VSILFNRGSFSQSSQAKPVSSHCKNEPALSMEGISGKELLSLQNQNSGFLNHHQLTQIKKLQPPRSIATNLRQRKNAVVLLGLAIAFLALFIYSSIV
jgi:hypothetical protein